MAKFSVKRIVGKRVSSCKTPAGSRYTFFLNKYTQLDTERDSDEAINQRVEADVEFFKNAEENRGKFEVIEGFSTNAPEEPVTEPETIVEKVSDEELEKIVDSSKTVEAPKSKHKGKKKRGGK